MMMFIYMCVYVWMCMSIRAKVFHIDGGVGGGGAVAAVVGAAAPGCAVILVSSGGRLHSSYVKVTPNTTHCWGVNTVV